MKKLNTVVVLLACLYSVNGFSWSDVGHRIVGLIAENALKKTKLETALKIQDLTEGESLATLATWPDEIRSDKTLLPGVTLSPEQKVPTENQLLWGWVPPLHYATTVDIKSYVAPPEGDIIQALAKLQEIMTSSDPVRVASAWMPPLGNFTSHQVRRIALSLIVHFVGDIHQPLHVGSGTDRGGNNCKVKWNGEVTNLHMIWDEKIIMHQNLSYTEYAAKLSTRKNLVNIDWETNDVLQWVRESIDERNKLYPKQIGVAADGRPYSYCTVDSKEVVIPAAGSKIEIPNLYWDYEYQFRPVIEKRLFQAGMRLAGFLDALFSSRASSNRALQDKLHLNQGLFNRGH